QPAWETRILSILLEITPNLATRATGIPLSSPYGTMWYLFDPTPFSWYKMDAHSMHFGLRIQTNTSILDLDGENRERTRLLLSQFSLRDQASNWHEHIPAGSITIQWSIFTTRFLAQFFPPGRNAKLRNDFLMFQQHQGECWNNPRDFSKPIKAISLPHDVPMNKLTSSCEICNGPQNTQYCMENPEQAFVEYASSRTDKAGGKYGLVHSIFSSSTGLLSFQFSSIDGLDAMLENGPWFIRNNQLILKKWHLDENLLKEDVSTVLRVGEKNTVKKPSQTSQGVPVPMGGTTNLVNNKATSSGSSFINVNNSSTRTTPIIDKIKKFEELLTSGKATLVDEDAPSERVGALPSDTVKNPKLKVNSTTLVLSARSYPTIDLNAHHPPPLQSMPSKHVPRKQAIPMQSLELGKNGSAFVQGEVSAKMEDPELFTLPCRLGDSKPFDTLADLGSCVNIIPLYLFKKLNIGLLAKSQEKQKKEIGVELFRDNMAIEHVPSPATTRSDDQILLFNAWAPIGKALTASTDVPSTFTVTTKTTSTLPPLTPPPQQSTVHQDIWSVLTDPKIYIKMDVVVPDSSRDVFRNSYVCHHDMTKCEHAGPKVTTSHGGITTTRMIKRFNVADDLKESSKGH
ncbi:MAK10-like protein, partial [Tanacetum coccineum]